MAQAVLQNPNVVYQFFDRMVFVVGGKALSVEIVTHDLYMRSITQKDLPLYQELYAAPKLFQKIEVGFDAWRQIGARVERWVRRWENEADPFSAFSIFKKDTNAFVGYIVSDCSEQIRVIDCVIHEREHGTGYGTQAVLAFVGRYLPALHANEKIRLKVSLPFN